MFKVPSSGVDCVSLLLLSVHSFFLGGARVSSTSLRCLSLHHNCTAGVASQFDRGGPVVAIRRRLSKQYSPKHVRLLVFITLSWENTLHMTIAHWEAKQKLNQPKNISPILSTCAIKQLPPDCVVILRD